ncbi:hypothetical protein GCM10028808_10490 [Spirosoma migulaei]
MKRAEKIAALTHALQGNVAKLNSLKRDQLQKVFLFIVDEVPKGWFGSPDTNDTPVKATYNLKNGTRVTEYLTYAQMKTMAKGAVLTILPDNHRRSKPE